LDKGVPSQESELAREAICRLGGAERQLWDAHERALRAPAGRMELVLHLSRLPSPRAHHVRVARVLMHDTAQRHAGQVFGMANHDLVLLCSDDGADEASRPHCPARLAANLARLFAIDMPDSARLISIWSLVHEPHALTTYLAGKAEQPSPQAAGRVLRDQSVSLAALQQIVARAPLAGLLCRQTGMSLSPERGRALAARLAPAFQRIALGLDELRLPDLVGCALDDAYLRHHFAEWLDQRMMALCTDDLSKGGRLLRPPAGPPLPVLIELGVRAIVSPEFAAMSRRAASAGVELWVGVKLLQAAADLDLLEHARSLLGLTGCRLTIVATDPSALSIVDTDCLRADLVVLPWSPRLRRAIAERPPLRRRPGQPAPRLILAETDGEHTLAWGQSMGIDLFAGPFLDQIQAATRMQRCHSAPGCTLTQCTGRARSMGPPRSGCSNPALLEAAFAPPRLAACG
jgi:hypothetical protein